MEDEIPELETTEVQPTEVKTPSIVNLGKRLINHFKVITLPSNEVHIYRNGVYVAGEDILELHITKLLKDNFRESKVQEIMNYIRHITKKEPIGLPNLINLKNGVYNINTKELMEHDKKYEFFYQIPTEYDPEATCPKFIEFITRSLYNPVNPTAVDTSILQEMCGYILMRGYPFQHAFVIVGVTCSGKTTFFKVIINVIGQHNVSHVSLSQLSGDRFMPSNLYQKKANIISEIERETPVNVSMVKRLTSEESLMFDIKHKDAFQFNNEAKLLFAANHLPVAKHGDDAYYRRWIVINFNNQVDTEDINPKLALELSEESPGILNWMIEGLHRLLEQDGFTKELTIPETKALFHGLTVEDYFKDKERQDDYDK